jgi:KDO2-lipid IV(A) lauroyltransferase
MEELEQNTKRGSAPLTIAHYVEYAGFWVIERGLRALSIGTATALSAFIWRNIAPRLSRHRRAMSNLNIAFPELSLLERQSIALDMWDNLGRTSVESFRLGSIADDASAVTLNFTEDALDVMKGPTPAIFVSLHSGNWEVTALAAEKFDRPLIGVYKKILNPLVDSAVTRVRSRFYKGGLVSRAPDTVRRITRAIKQGYSVALMADLRDSHGDFVPFFGIPSRSTNFPALLARLHHLPVIAVRATRTSPGHFRIDGERLDLAETADRKADIVENTARLQALLERWIRENPALWMWGHRRWNAESFKAMKR